MRTSKFEHRFVGGVPDEMESGVFYISLDFSTMMHLCACGCGREVITPLSPKDWNFTFDGQSVSVSPSIGSWSLPCRSHYIIKKGAIHWASDWSDEQIRRGRQIDLERKRGQAPTKEIRSEPIAKLEQEIVRTGFIRRVLNWFRG